MTVYNWWVDITHTKRPPAKRRCTKKEAMGRAVWKGPQGKRTYVGFAFSCQLLLPMCVTFEFPKVIRGSALFLLLDRLDDVA